VTIEKEDREKAARMLSALLGSETQTNLELVFVVKSGNIKSQITAVIREQHADIVVMGTHERGLFGRCVIGSTTEGMLRKISIPLLTVCRVTKPMAFNRILFATDLSESSKQGFYFALELAATIRSDLIVVYALDQTPLLKSGCAEMVPYVTQLNIEEAKATFAGFVTEGSHAKVKVEALVAEGIAAEEILKAGDRNSADLIVLTVGKKGFVEQALLGTTAERVIREASVPVLSIPANVRTERQTTPL